MTPKTTLRIAQLLVKLLRVLAWFGLGVMILLTVITLVAPDRLDFVAFNNQQLQIEWTTDAAVETAPAPRGVLLFNMAKVTAYIILLLLVLRPAHSILNSIKRLDTFHLQNVHALRTMGKLFLIWWVISWFNVTQSAEALRMGFHFDLTLLICALVAYILSAVFEEGNRLMEENQLTI